MRGRGAPEPHLARLRAANQSLVGPGSAAEVLRAIVRPSRSAHRANVGLAAGPKCRCPVHGEFRESRGRTADGSLLVFDTDCATLRRMRRSTRMEQYRKRRHRTAIRRRGIELRRPRTCAVTSDCGAAREAGGADFQDGFWSALTDFTRRVSSYPAVAGLLYRSKSGPAELCVVAPRPMTEPMRILVSTWAREFVDRFPGFDWVFKVLPAPPRDANTYKCAFWCSPREGAGVVEEDVPSQGGTGETSPACDPGRQRNGASAGRR